MVDVDVVTVKLAEIADRLERVRLRCPADAEALASDRDALELVSFNLILAIQAALDVASHVIADEGWPAAATLAESFVRLHEHQVISAETLAGVRPAARLRNILAHMYSSVDPARVHLAATSGLEVLERFAAEVGTWVRDLSGGEEAEPTLALDQGQPAAGAEPAGGGEPAGNRESMDDGEQGSEEIDAQDG